MMLKFHGMKNEIKITRGDLIHFVRVDGTRTVGLLVGWEIRHPRFLPDLVLNFLTNIGYESVRVAMIFRCEIIR